VPVGSGPTVRRILLGSRLRRLRERNGVSREVAGYHIRGSESKISRLELGRVGFKKRDVEDLLTLYGVVDDAEREQVLALVREANQQGWWQPYAGILPSWFPPYIDLEESASLIRTYEFQVVPGLLQTEDYARAVMSHRPGMPKNVIDGRVDVRMHRQKLLTRPDGPRLWIVVDEAALCRHIGGRRVARAQIAHLLELTDHPALTLQVMPFAAGGHAADGGAFTMLRFPDPDLTDIIYQERLTGAAYLDKREDVDEYTMAMNQLCHDSATPDKTVDILHKIAAGL
jgi:transcriptional regulator with XRE-family HTH domain